MLQGQPNSGDSLTTIELEPKNNTKHSGSNPPFGVRFSVLKMGRPS